MVTKDVMFQKRPGISLADLMKTRRVFMVGERFGVMIKMLLTEDASGWSWLFEGNLVEYDEKGNLSTQSLLTWVRGYFNEKTGSGWYRVPVKTAASK